MKNMNPFKSIFARASKETSFISPRPAEARDGKDAAGNVSFQGDLSVLPLDDVAQLFEFSKLTGELEVISNDNRGFFFFQNGLLVFAMLGNSNHKIGELLVVNSLITEEQLSECLTIQKHQEPQERLGKILIQKGYLEQDSLSLSLTEQIKKAFFEVLTWKEGKFFFYVDQAPQKEDMICSERIDTLLLEGMTYIDENAL
jgi:hypothetical protein